MRLIMAGLTIVTVLITSSAVGQSAGGNEWSAALHVIRQLHVYPEDGILRLQTVGLIGGIPAFETINPAGCEQNTTVFDIELGTEFDHRNQLLIDAAYLAHTTNAGVFLLISGDACSNVDLSDEFPNGARVIRGIKVL